MDITLKPQDSENEGEVGAQLTQLSRQESAPFPRVICAYVFERCHVRTFGVTGPAKPPDLAPSPLRMYARTVTLCLRSQGKSIIPPAPSIFPC